ncbi:cation:proton antiporter [bacterium]|nr:cation:proton antiporter [bacterium]
METFINISLFSMLAITAISVVKTRSLFAIVALSGVFSLLSALLFITWDAVDVAFTEAAVGAGISTVLMLGTLALTSRTEKESQKSNFFPLLAVILAGAVMIYGTLDMPNFGSSDTPAQTHVGPDYLQRIPQDIHVPNAVTAILASYRGYDTLGETAVVFAAGIGVLMLISSLRRRRNDDENEDSSSDTEDTT